MTRLAAATVLGLTLTATLATAPTPAPDFTLETTGGGAFHLADHRSEAVVLVFMFPGAPSYELLEPSLKRVHWRFENDGATSARFAILGISIIPTQPLSVLEEYKTAREIPWAIARDTANVTAAYGVAAVVTVVLVGLEGEVAWEWTVQGTAWSPSEVEDELGSRVNEMIVETTAEPIGWLLLAFAGVTITTATLACVAWFVVLRRKARAPPAS
ncbi:MAG TPA: redoxin domain-containing protein [Thermoplasmata archaeon]|nr:redoxin domain-containing protein [Thermoplasmata archaeon]